MSAEYPHDHSTFNGIWTILDRDLALFNRRLFLPGIQKAALEDREECLTEKFSSHNTGNTITQLPNLVENVACETAIVFQGISKRLS